MAREFVIVVTVDAESQPIEHRVAGLPVSLGRDPANDVQVASQFVSGVHAKIEEVKGRVFVRDLGSRNGTQVVTADGAKARVAPHALYDLSQCNSQFFLGSSVRVQVIDAAAAGQPWRPGGGSARPAIDSFMDAPLRGGRGLEPLPGLGNPSVGWDRPNELRAPDLGNGPLSLPPLPGERSARGSGSRQPLESTPLGRSDDLPPPVHGSDDLPPPAHGSYDLPPPAHGSYELPPPVHGSYDPPPPVRGFEPVGGAHAYAPGGAAAPNLATGNFQLSLDNLALQGLRELVGSLLPGQQLQTQGDVARLITRLHDAIDVLCRTLIPLRQSYLGFVASMDLQKSAHFAQASAVLDMARDPAAVAAALLDFREHAPEASKALENALNDLTTHQVAMLDGVMQGVRSLLEELSPAAVSDAAEGRRAGLRLGGREKEIWDEYCQRYERLSEESEAFSRIFGAEFAQAYRRYRRRAG